MVWLLYWFSIGSVWGTHLTRDRRKIHSCQNTLKYAKLKNIRDEHQYKVIYDIINNYNPKQIVIETLGIINNNSINNEICEK